MCRHLFQRHDGSTDGAVLRVMLVRVGFARLVVMFGKLAVRVVIHRHGNRRLDRLVYRPRDRQQKRRDQREQRQDHSPGQSEARRGRRWIRRGDHRLESTKVQVSCKWKSRFWCVFAIKDHRPRIEIRGR